MFMHRINISPILSCKTHISFFQHQHIEYKDEDGYKIKEEVEIDDKDNVAKYTVTADNGQVFHVTEDFGRVSTTFSE